MRLRLFPALTILASIAILATILPTRAWPATAQSQPPSATAPGPVPDRAKVSAALRSAPVMFVENVGQFDSGARFQVRGGDRTIWLANDDMWITAMEKTALTPDPSPKLGEGNREAVPPRPLW